MEIEQLQNQIVSALEIKTDMGKEAVHVFLECMKLLDKKQQDYGSSNIAPSIIDAPEIMTAIRVS